MPNPSDVNPLLQEMYNNRWYTNFGPLNARFEAEMVEFLAESGSPGLSVGTFSSATTGLELILRAMRLPEGGKVLVPALTFPATALAVINAGLVPVLGDVDPYSWELTPEIAMYAHEKQDYVAVIPVAAFGKPVPTAGWQTFQRDTGIPVVLDTAAVLGQQQVPTDLTAVFSLHATKPFGVGEGGLVATSDVALLERAQSLSNFGFLGTAGVVQQIGTNAKFGEYYAAVGLTQIQRWPEVIERRRKVADVYLDKLSQFGNSIRLQAGVEGFVPAVLPIFAKGKGAEIFAAMTDNGIQTRHWYLPLLHKHPALDGVDVVNADGLMACDELGAGLVGLPFHSFLTCDDIDKICAVLAEVV